MGGKHTKSINVHDGEQSQTNNGVSLESINVLGGEQSQDEDKKPDDYVDLILKAIKQNEFDNIQKLVTPKGLTQNSLERSPEKKEPEKDDTDDFDTIQKRGTQQIDVESGTVTLGKRDTSKERDEDVEPQNSLERSLKVSFHLKKAHGPNSKKIKSVGDKVEDFACRLLEYSESVPGIVNKSSFRDCIEKLTDTALKFKAKKFLAAPQIQNSLQQLWAASNYKEMDTSSTWIFLNIWAIVEVFMFPFVMLSLFVHHKIFGGNLLDREDPITKLPEKTMEKFAKHPKSVLKKRYQTIAGLREEYEKLQYFERVKEIEKCIKDQGLDSKSHITELPERTMKIFANLPTSLLESPEQTITQLRRKYEKYEKYVDMVQEIDKCIKDPYGCYKGHFETPYFIFFRDMISYTALLVLHYFVCVQTTGLQFSVLEWIIMAFFVGRVLFEVDQCINEGSRYLSDFWNKMDFASIVVYIFTIICRGLVKQPKSDLLVMASYSYGINAMLLTLRVFGQLMEIKESTGTKQIALLKIISAVAVIFVQIVSTMIGFSFVLTKIYMAEVSHLAETNVTAHGVCKHSIGITCWWHFFEFLAWSIVGSGDPNLLTLENGFSNYISKVLFLFFLIVTAVLIMNMLIALLSNTYQEVEDNAFNEWAYRKAYIIKTYNSCHPVPVPLSIISIPLKLFYKCYRKHCLNRTSENKTQKEEEDNKNQLVKLCEIIEEKYFAEHGDYFPQDSLSEIDRQLSQNRQFMGQIANELFKESTTSHSVSDIHIPKEWKCSNGINAVGRQLFHVKCDDCKIQRIHRYCVHGALYNSFLSKEWPGFEVLIQRSGKGRNIGIGVASSKYNLYDFPGRKPNSVGYHVDTGAIFDKNNRKYGHIKAEDSMSFAGDLVGCMVLFDEEQEEQGVKYLRVQFTRNGRLLGEAMLEANLVRDIRPLISMACSGIHVMFRKCFKNVQGAPISSSKMIQDMEKSIEQLQRHVAETAHNLKCLKESVYKENQADPSNQDQSLTHF